MHLQSPSSAKKSITNLFVCDLGHDFFSLLSCVTLGYDKRIEQKRKKKKTRGTNIDKNSFFSKNGLKNMHPKSEVNTAKNICLALWTDAYTCWFAPTKNSNIEHRESQGHNILHPGWSNSKNKFTLAWNAVKFFNKCWPKTMIEHNPCFVGLQFVSFDGDWKYQCMNRIGSAQI